MTNNLPILLTLVVLMFGLPGLSTAADPASIAIEDAFPATALEAYVQQALSTNPELKALEAAFRAAEQRVPQAATLPDPMISWTYFVESVQTRTGPQESAFTLSQRFPWPGKLSNSKKSASADAQAAWYALESRRLSLQRSVAVGFFEYAYVGRAIDLTRQNRDWLMALEPTIEERVKAGGDINPLLRLKVEIGKVDDSLQSLKQRRLVESAQLGELMALPYGTRLPWPTWDAPEVIELDGDTIAREIRTENPALHLRSEKVRSATAQEEIARHEGHPDFTAGLNYILVGDPEANTTTADAGKDPWGLTFAMNIPLFRKKNRAVRSEATFARTGFERQYDQQLNALLAQLQSSLALLDDANRRLSLYGDDLLGLAEQAVENSRTSYQADRTGILEVIDSERSLLELQLLYWRAAADAWQQRVTIQTLANQPVSLTAEVLKSDE